MPEPVLYVTLSETEEELRVVSVVKKRGGAHERSIREFHLDRGGISVGPPLRHFRGVLTGVPVEERSEAPRDGESLR